RALGVELGVAGDGAAGRGRLLGDVGKGERFKIAGIGAGGLGVALLPHHGLRRDAPDLGGATAELADAVAGGLDGGHAGGEGGAAALGDVVVAERAGVGGDRADLLVGHAQLLGCYQAHGGAGTADVDRADGERDGAV